MSADFGAILGYGSIFGNLDRQGEIVDPGAFSRSLPAFRRAGFISWGHDIARPVATIHTAIEDNIGLKIEARFHSTADGQAARTIVNERLAAGKDCGLSIGYLVVRDRMQGSIRHLLDVELLEVAITLMPSNTLATILTAKGAKAGPAIPFRVRETRRFGTVDVLLAEARLLGVRV